MPWRISTLYACTYIHKYVHDSVESLHNFMRHCNTIVLSAIKVEGIVAPFFFVSNIPRKLLNSVRRRREDRSLFGGRRIAKINCEQNERVEDALVLFSENFSRLKMYQERRCVGRMSK